jgi:hypothetical protein
MRRILWTLAPVTVGAALALCAASAQAAPTPMQLPELILPTPSHHAHRSAGIDHRKNGELRDLGDYNVPGEQRGDSASARLDTSAGILL